jgi:hypothetical protein
MSNLYDDLFNQISESLKRGLDVSQSDAEIEVILSQLRNKKSETQMFWEAYDAARLEIAAERGRRAAYNADYLTTHPNTSDGKDEFPWDVWQCLL